MTFNTSRLTPEQREAAARDEHNAALIREAVASAEEIGAGSTSHSEEGAQTRATYAQLKDTKAFATGNRPSLVPAHIKTKKGVVTRLIFTQADYEAILDGRYCARCWDLQLQPALPEWAITAPQVCETVKHRSCGWPKGRKWINRLPHEISPLPPAN